MKNTIARKVTIIGQVYRYFSTEKSLILNFDDMNSGKNLTDVIQRAYGPKGHGILFVRGIPNFTEVRQRTLPLFWHLGNLPPQKLKKYERPEILHSLGWSCGVEQFHGKYDTSKGSYYINCVSDEPQPISAENLKYYTADELKMNVGNKWVDQIPQIEQNVKQLSSLMIMTGKLLARQIDAFAEKNVQNYKKGHLQRIITQGRNHIGRILHYLPFEKVGETEDDWCGWHNDHGSLTALTSAMYIDENGKQVDLKTQTGGLYAKNRFAEMTKIAIPKDCLAFQLGESTQIHTGGSLEATPHCVVRSDQIAGKNIARNTFALFMEPNNLQIMQVPQGIPEQKVTQNQAYKIPSLKDRWKNKMFFKQLNQVTIKYYS